MYQSCVWKHDGVADLEIKTEKWGGHYDNYYLF